MQLSRGDRNWVRSLLSRVDDLYMIAQSFLDDEFDDALDEIEDEEVRAKLDDIRWTVESARDCLDQAYNELKEILE